MPETLQVVCTRCDATNRVAPARLADGATCGACRAPLFDGQPVELTATNFDRLTRATDIPLVVDFWAAWCGPCQAMAPAFADAAARLAPAVRLGKLDTEAESDIAARFGIRSIPTLVAFRDGREVARQSGALRLPDLLAWIKHHAA